MRSFEARVEWRIARRGVLVAGALSLALLASISTAQDTHGRNHDREPEQEEQSSAWEFVPGTPADIAAGMRDARLLEEELEQAQAQGELAAGFDPRGLFIEHVEVRLLPLVFRIVDPFARPIEGLTADDLEATVGDVALPVAAVDWYGSYEAPEVREAWSAASSDAPADASEWNRPPDPYGYGASPSATPSSVDGARHLVIFMQIGDFYNIGLERGLVWGHLKSLPGLERLLRGLGPGDRVALVSHGAHMALWHDFTTDHRAIYDLLFDTIGYGDPLAPPRAADGPSLARAFENAALRDVTNTAEAMRLLADAMAEIPGTKDVIYVGWSFAGAREDVQAALGTLAQHQTVVSVIVSAQKAVPRGGSLVALARHTGGTIDGTVQFPGRSLDRLARSLAGHYVVSFDLSGIEQLEGRLVLRVKGREAEILSRPYVF